MRVHIDGVIELKLARDIGQRGHQIVVVGATRILGANRNHALGAAQVVAHAAHVHADHLARVGRHKGTAVTDLLVHGKEQRHLARERHLASGDGTRQAQQNRRRQLVVKEATLNVAALRHHGARIHSDDVASLNTQLEHIVLAVNVLVEQDLHVLLDGLDRLIGHMRRRLGIEDHACVDLAATRVDGAVLAIGRGPLVPTERRRTQAAIVLNGSHHGAKRVDMARQHERLTLAAELNQHIALIGALGLKAHIAQGFHQIISRRTSKARRRGNRSQRLKLVSNKTKRRIHLGHHPQLQSQHPVISKSPNNDTITHKYLPSEMTHRALPNSARHDNEPAGPAR